MARDIFDNHGICADARTITNRDRTDNLGARPDVYVITNQRDLAPFGADGDLVFELDGAAAADLAVDNNTGAVDQDKPRAGTARRVR